MRSPTRVWTSKKLEERVEPVGSGVVGGDGVVQRLRHLRPLLGEAGELPGEHLLVAMPAGDALAGGRRRRGEELEGVGDEGEVRRAAAAGRLGGQRVERARGDRHAVLVVMDLEAAATAHQHQLAGLQHSPVVVAEDRQQHRVVQPRLGGVPVDVEEAGVAAGGAILQHVPPPAVAPFAIAGDRHVVGDDVEHLAEPVLAERRAEAGVPRLPPQLVVDPAGIDHVVAVRAPPRRLEVRRAVEMRDPEVGEIAGDRRGLGEAELGAKLDAISRERSFGHAWEACKGRTRV